ncbi:hypothetical protein [Arthrobacter sp. UYP6]|uniref:hypothetical protein n=1 Tax=Arthrobacter sp. UYP6 TaxID=1756378 RepID=UPI0033926659
MRERIERITQSAGDGNSGGYAAEPEPSANGPRRHKLLKATGAVAAAVGLVLSTAYLLGGYVQAPSLQKAPGLAAVWSDVTGGVEREQLAPEQLAQLRARGWVCPELTAAGMSLTGARAARVDGQPAVVMTLEGMGSTVTVYETHPDSEDAVVDGVTGRPVTEEGFILREQNPGHPQVWVHPQRPHQAVLASRRVTYTVDAAPPGDILDEAVSEISLTESSRLVVRAPDTAQGVLERIQRGLSVMTGTGGQG